MDTSYRTPNPNEYLSTPYKQVISQYVTPEQRPQDINLQSKAFPQNFTVRQNNVTYEYKPKVIMSGFIVGEPVAFTETPKLPTDFHRFSPSKENLQKPFFLQKTHGDSNLANLSTSVFRNQQNTVHQQVLRGNSMGNSRNRILTSLPVGETVSNMVRRQDYERLMNENIMLRVENTRLSEENKRLSLQIPNDGKDRRISELERQISVLKQQFFPGPISQGISSSYNSHMSQSERKVEGFSSAKIQQIEEILSVCLSKYRQSILQEQKLLVDRFRLQSKNQELDLKKQKLIESRKQQHQTHRRSSYYDKVQQKQISPSKENWPMPYRHSHSQRHWKK